MQRLERKTRATVNDDDDILHGEDAYQTLAGRYLFGDLKVHFDTECSHHVTHLSICDKPSSCDHQRLFLADIRREHCAGDDDDTHYKSVVKKQVEEVQLRLLPAGVDSEYLDKYDPFHGWDQHLQTGDNSLLQYKWPFPLLIMDKKPLVLTCYFPLSAKYSRASLASADIPVTVTELAATQEILKNGGVKLDLAKGEPYATILHARLLSANIANSVQDSGIALVTADSNGKQTRHTGGITMLNTATPDTSMVVVRPGVSQFTDRSDTRHCLSSLSPTLSEPWSSRLLCFEESIINTAEEQFSFSGAPSLLVFPCPLKYMPKVPPLPATAEEAYDSEKKRYNPIEYKALQFLRFMTFSYPEYFRQTTDMALNDPSGVSIRRRLINDKQAKNAKLFQQMCRSEDEKGEIYSTVAKLPYTPDYKDRDYLGYWQQFTTTTDGKPVDVSHMVITRKALRVLFDTIRRAYPVQNTYVPFSQIGLSSTFLSPSPPPPPMLHPTPSSPIPLQYITTATSTTTPATTTTTGSSEHPLISRSSSSSPSVPVSPSISGDPSGVKAAKQQQRTFQSGIVADPSSHAPIYQSFELEITLAQWRKRDAKPSVLLYSISKEPSGANVAFSPGSSKTSEGVRFGSRSFQVGGRAGRDATTSSRGARYMKPASSSTPSIEYLQ